ncbi:Methyltransferase domain-containing protein [Hymenobacter daecheongensis DSM 21074]|uniref:Methyltransferase domain-containing protein n=1 Tax=Hymenobacter daecheongensis DSM 21074 TaxID=1121955 RepID=A0A1M6C4D1_9BACT|nr:class I SAM-dependent methyltransferase [Hymenobacter daecheongensis]SHI55594.1 Methyltransferase domain-containing protein [Hymenobacter daecheongensis DSM 21074]
MLFQALSYIRFLLRSGNAHGLHSPFVFGLYTRVIDSQHDAAAAYAPIEARRQALRQNPAIITVRDFGAGSHTGAGRQRRLRDIARTAAKPRQFGQLLFRLVQHFQPKVVLELGTSLGLTTAYLAAANAQAQVVTFEGCPQTAAVARQTFVGLGLTNIELVEGNLDETLAPTLTALPGPLDFAFFDGNHRYEPTVRYFEQCLPYRTDQSVFILDDIHWSAEMARAWRTIKQHPEVMLTIDLFFIGLVFFRKNQPKQHFTLRFDNVMDKLLNRVKPLSA